MKHSPIPHREGAGPVDRRPLHPIWCECRRCHAEASRTIRLDLLAIAAGLAVAIVALIVLALAANVPAVARALGL